MLVSKKKGYINISISGHTMSDHQTLVTSAFFNIKITSKTKNNDL